MELEKLRSRLLDVIDAAVIVVDIESGRILHVNQKVADDLNCVRGEIKDKHYRDFFLPEFIPICEELLRSSGDEEGHTAIFYWAEKAVWEQISGKVIQWEGGPKALLITITNVSEAMREQYKYQQMAYFDTILGLPNGRRLEEDVNELANIESVTLIYFELKRLDEINDLYGWDAGDQLLASIRDWMLESEWARAQLYHVDKGFASLGRRATIDNAKKRAEEILARFREPWNISVLGNTLSVRLAIRLGIVHGKYIRNEMRNLSIRTLRADDKELGYTIYDDETDRHIKESIRQRDTLINCILSGMVGFEVYYQPIVEAGTRRWTGVEALCRWKTPEGDSVPPTVFIQLAEQLRLIDLIDSWVRKTAMLHCVSLGLSDKSFHLNVNFSPTQKIDASFVDNMFHEIQESAFYAKKLNVEITESARMPFDEENIRGLRKLKEGGIVLSLDDFGTGYSSFENLISASASAIKIEKLFIDDIETDSYRQYVLKILVDVAHHLNMCVIAEGVETEEQMRIVENYGVDYAQGYLFSKPMPVAQLEQETWRFVMA